MPAQISHCLAAELALQRVDPQLAEAWGMGGELLAASSTAERAMEEAAWFRFGAQGPDIFYHNQRSKPSGIHYGPLAHKRNYGLFVEAALRRLIETGLSLDGKEGAWILGYSTHAALDRALHPFIVHFSGWQAPSQPESARYRSCHPFLERILDILALERLAHRPVSECDLETLLPLDEPPAEAGTGAGGSVAVPTAESNIAALIQKGLEGAFPHASSADFFIGHRIANAISDSRFFFRATNPSRTSTDNSSFLAHFDDRSGYRAVALLYPRQTGTGIDFGNEAGALWAHPAGDGRESKESAATLFDRGVEAGAASLRLTLEALRSGGIPFGFATAIGNGGLSVNDAEGFPVPPRISHPLPLAELMEAEFACRLEEAKGLVTGRS
ncbi:MAG: hypothetical protein ACOYM2_06085 [Rectinemataceae bacterium]